MDNPVRLEMHGDIAVIITNNPPVNALSSAVRHGLFDALEQAKDDSSIRAFVLHCEGRTFFAGADIREFSLPPESPLLHEVVDRIESEPRPVVAALHGTVLGGGLEIALGCHVRIAASETKLGLPEVKLGILPGAGGTQRLPRLVGAAKAFEIISSGRQLSAGEALGLGIVDDIAGGDLLAQAIDAAREAAGGSEPLRRISEMPLQRDRQREKSELEETALPVLKKRKGYPAYAAIVESIGNSIDMEFGEAQARERELLLELRSGYKSQALRHLFFAERQARKIPDMPEGTKPRTIDRVAVLGSGTMGGGIAMSFASAGISVTLHDPNKDALAAGMEKIRENYDRSARRAGEDSAWTARRMDRILPTTEFDRVADAGLIVEAVFEDMELKRKIFADLDRICADRATFATNTSTLDVNEIAAATSRPESVVGMHFFSPANVMRLVEIVRGAKTGFETLATAIEVSRAINKLPVTVGVCHGFVGNRMLYARNAQVERLLLEGASPAWIDRVLTDFGFAMGPCAVSDLAGIDVGWRIRQQDGRTAPVADALYELGRYGQKNGRGFYRYEEGSRKPLEDPEVTELTERMAHIHGIKRREIEAEEIFQRLIYPMINEGAKILDEGIATRASDIDLIWVNGYGWPAYEGGPMFLANRLGLAPIAASLEELAVQLGDETFRPAPLLRDLAGNGWKFAS